MSVDNLKIRLSCKGSPLWPKKRYTIVFFIQNIVNNQHCMEEPNCQNLKLINKLSNTERNEVLNI